MIDPRTVPVRFSNLKAFSQSPAHYLAALERDWDSAALSKGRLVHALLFGTPYTVFEGDRRGNAWKDFKERHAGEEIFRQADVDEARRIADAVMLHPEAPRLLAGYRERQIEWLTGSRACSGRLDVYTARLVTDLKTTRCSRPDWFAREAIKRGYHAQLAWYQDGLALAKVAAPVEAYIVAVESTPPYPVTVLRLTDAALEMGRRLYRSWFEQLLVCEASNEWPGYTSAVVDLDAPEQDGDVTLIVDGEEVAA